jgi:leader peptidase (prepilin peptidase)/N-methyltransferase
LASWLFHSNTANDRNVSNMGSYLGYLFFQSDIGLPWYLGYVLVVAVGGVVGSFLNVVIHRVPNNQSIVFPNSRCPKCGTAIKPYDNIPVFSWLVLLRGRCRACKESISARYPAVEALTAAIWLLVVWRIGFNAALPFDLIFVTAIIALIFIDAENMILPNVITYPGLVFALVARIAIPLIVQQPYFDDLSPGFLAMFGHQPIWLVSLAGALIGAAVGGGSLWLVGFIWEKLRGVEAMGLGDVKMMFMVGAFLGWRLTLLTIFLGAMSGALIGIGMMIKTRDRNLQSMLPFGIFLGIGTIAALLFGVPLINWYLAQFVR